MRFFKKLMACLLAAALLCGSHAVSVSADVLEEKTINDSSKEVVISENGLTITFYFSYSDGNSAEYKRYIVNQDLHNLYNVNFSGSGFSGDRASATVKVTNRYNNESMTYGAWCDIYGQTGAFIY